jgi:threonylcarbamoyladenosine tRNA methylthiotransferase MtaB
LGSLDPTAITDAFLQTARAMPKLCPHFHLSLQSGCARTLTRMNRRYTPGRYADTVARLRAYFPDAAITTDVIAGFPGETEADFEESLAFIREIAFFQMHVFVYSPKKGTPAADFPDPIAPHVKEARAQALRSLGREQTQRFYTTQIGKTFPVLFETENNGIWEGHTMHYCTVRIESDAPLLNRILPVRLTHVADGILYGKRSK